MIRTAGKEGHMIETTRRRREGSMFERALGALLLLVWPGLAFAGTLPPPSYYTNVYGHLYPYASNSASDTLVGRPVPVNKMQWRSPYDSSTGCYFCDYLGNQTSTTNSDANGNYSITLDT